MTRGRGAVTAVQAGIIELNIHGKTKEQARAAIEAALRRSGSSVYRLRVIHGYNRGTELRDMLWREYGAHGRVLRIAPGANPGVTEFVLREL